MMENEQNKKVDPRVVLAVERTLLAWIRTGLAMMGFGFVVARFGIFLREITPAATLHPPGKVSIFAGTALVLAGVFTSVAGVWDHRRVLRLIRKDEPIDSRTQPAVVIAFTIAVIGLGLAMYLIAR